MPTLRTLAACATLSAAAITLGCAPARPPQAQAGAGADVGPASAPGAPAPSASATGALAVGIANSYFDRQAQELGAIPGTEVRRTDGALVVSLPDGALYDASSAELSPGGVERVRSLARTVQSYPKERVIVKSHTDGDGNARSNQRLSEDRADGVRNLLIAEGVAPSRISAVGLGATLPVATNSTAEGREQNRRVEVELRPDDDVVGGEAAQ
ncbi:MAG: OmpA family protein [Myxococcota bacterium]